MKKAFSLLAALCCGLSASAQLDGTSYFLPKTALRFTVLAEKTTYTPGDFAVYSEKYLKEEADEEASTTYRVLTIKMTSLGIPDSSRVFTAKIDAKHSITSLQKNSNGVIMAINTTGKEPEKPKAFVPGQKAKPLNPRDYMTQDILSAGSKAKMAELTALEIYDIRENKNLLNKGQADFMPKDGEQLKIMLDNLTKQETALMQLFQGTTLSDTTEMTFVYVPEKEVSKDILFRFSKKIGFVDKDDLAGTPYYISIEDEHNIPTIDTTIELNEKNKEDAGIYVNLPGKIKATLFNNNREMASYELYAAQFGRVAAMQGELFGKKLMTKLAINPITGSIDRIETELVKK